MSIQHINKENSFFPIVSALDPELHLEAYYVLSKQITERTKHKCCHRQDPFPWSNNGRYKILQNKFNVLF